MSGNSCVHAGCSGPRTRVAGVRPEALVGMLGGIVAFVWDQSHVNRLRDSTGLTQAQSSRLEFVFQSRSHSFLDSVRSCRHSLPLLSLTLISFCQWPQHFAQLLVERATQTHQSEVMPPRLFNQSTFICAARTRIQRRLEALCTAREGEASGPQSTSSKNSPAGRSPEQIQSPGGRRLPRTSWAEEGIRKPHLSFHIFTCHVLVFFTRVTEEPVGDLLLPSSFL